MRLLDEPLVGLADAARYVPRERGQQPPHPATMARWITDGVRQIKLEAIRRGGKWLTSRQAVERFTARLTEVCSREMTEAS